MQIMKMSLWRLAESVSGSQSATRHFFAVRTETRMDDWFGGKTNRSVLTEYVLMGSHLKSMMIWRCDVTNPLSGAFALNGVALRC